MSIPIYDKFFQEVMDDTIGFFLKKFLKEGENYVVGERLERDFQEVVARELDFLYQVKDKDGNIAFLLHTEVESAPTEDILSRLHVYGSMVYLKKKQRVFQFCIDLSDGHKTLPDTLEIGFYTYKCIMIKIKNIEAEEFLNSLNPYLIILSILGRSQNYRKLIKEIINKLKSINMELSEVEKYLKDMFNLARLRKKTFKIVEEELLNMKINFEEERDPLYKRGKVKGKVEGKVEGIAEGIAEGKIEAQIDVIQTSFKNGWLPEKIASFFGFNLDFVHSALKQK